MSRLPLHVMQHPGRVAAARLDAGTVPDWGLDGASFASVTQTSHETSVICDADLVPEDVRQEGPFVPFEVAGPLAVDLVGVITDLLEPLVDEKIPVLATSTFDTDWIFVPEELADGAVEAWRRHGFVVTPTSLTDWSPSGGTA